MMLKWTEIFVRAEGKDNIEPDGILDNFRRETKPFYQIIELLIHAAIMP